MDAGLDPSGAERHEEARPRLGVADSQCCDPVGQCGHGDVAKLTDAGPPEWQLRVGDRRVFFRFRSDLREIHLLRVRRRNDAYR
jgi:mRNA-degrading endonuclease RelE of RelBE toxin-antitoxin system